MTYTELTYTAEFSARLARLEAKLDRLAQQRKEIKEKAN